MSLSAAGVGCAMASKRKIPFVKAIAVPAGRRTLNLELGLNLGPVGHGFSPHSFLRKPLSRSSVVKRGS